MSGGEALTRSLIREGVEVVFGIPGIHMSGSVVAMRDEPSIRHITTRHVNGATHMAYAYARSTPVFLIAGQISRGQMGKDLDAIHEVFNQAEVVASVTKWRRQAMRPSEVPAAVSEAFSQMRTGRPRPFYLEMPPEVAVEREEVQLRDPCPALVHRAQPGRPAASCRRHREVAFALDLRRRRRHAVRRGGCTQGICGSDEHPRRHFERRQGSAHRQPSPHLQVLPQPGSENAGVEPAL